MASSGSATAASDAPPDVAVIDYGMGNLHSVASALESVAPEARVVITGDGAQIARARRVVLPGVGAIRDCMQAIRDQGVDRVIAEVMARRIPLLGVCVGLQVLLDGSDENGGVKGLGVFQGQVRSFSGYDAFADGRLKVPHMGWNRVRQRPHPLWAGIPDGARFYFVHSYCVQSEQSGAIAGLCDYGVEFSAALYRDNLFAVQFHPEKSHTHGLQLLRNFMTWDGVAPGAQH